MSDRGPNPSSPLPAASTPPPTGENTAAPVQPQEDDDASSPAGDAVVASLWAEDGSVADAGDLRAATGSEPYAEPAPFEIGASPFSLSGPDDEPEPEEPRRSTKVRTIVLSSLLAIGLAGAATLGYTGWQISSQKDATVTIPARIGGLVLDDSEDGKSTGDYLQTALATEVDLDHSVGAVYRDTSKKSILFFGGTGLIWTPDSDLDTAFGLISDQQGAVTGLHDVDAGKFGGTMRCGTTKSDDGTLPVCGWADHGSLALAMFPDRTEAESAPLLRQIRDATQTRN